MSEVIRQGDVLLVKKDLPTEGEVQPKKGRIILAEGEATGHAHAIPTDEADVVVAANMRFVVVPEDGEATLTHEEHAPAKLFGGSYLTGAQVEYSPAAVRRVLD